MPFVLVVAGALASSTASAGPFLSKTMQDQFFDRTVERPLVLGKGWVELALRNDFKLANGYWDENGDAQEFSSASFLYTTQTLEARYGMMRRVELNYAFRTHYLALQNPDLGTDTRQFGAGDPTFGVTFDLFRTLTPLSNLVTYAKYKVPFANESPGNRIGGPNTFSSFILTTGTPDLSLGMKGKQQFGPMALELDYTFVKRFSSVVLYAIETDYYQFAARLKPGDIHRVAASAILQAGPVAVEGGAVYERRDEIQIGNTSGGLLPSSELNSIANSDGQYLNANVGATVNIGTRLDLFGSMILPLQGEDLQFFPIEDLHPTRGNTYTGALKIRY
jgi:hypothetical protein